MDDEVQSKTKIDGIVTLVDAKHVLLHWDSHEVQEQIAFGDVILLNKTDLVTPAELDKLEELIRKMNATAKIYRTKNAEVNLDQVLNVKGFDLDRILEHEPEFLKNGGHKHHHDHKHEDGERPFALRPRTRPLRPRPRSCATTNTITRACATTNTVIVNTIMSMSTNTRRIRWR